MVVEVSSTISSSTAALLGMGLGRAPDYALTNSIQGNITQSGSGTHTLTNQFIIFTGFTSEGEKSGMVTLVPLNGDIMSNADANNRGVSANLSSFLSSPIHIGWARYSGGLSIPDGTAKIWVL